MSLLLPASACEQAAFQAVVGEASARLSAMNDENKRAFQAKLASLRAREGWSDADFPAKATPFAKDATTTALDEGNRQLLEKVPHLGGGQGIETASAATDLAGKRCAMLEELRGLMGKVVENTRGKWAHMLGKLDAALQGPVPAKAASK